MSEAEDFSSGLRQKLAKLSLRPVREREEKEHLQFSPTHFSVDLFAPHATTEQVVGEIADEEAADDGRVGRQDSLELSGSGNMSPRQAAQTMLTMLEALKQLNQPGSETLTEEEWEELAMTWSVPIAGARTDLIKGGHAVRVPLRDKDAYCDLASEALRTCIRQADMYA